MNLLLLQMSIVLMVTVGCGWIARQLGQARVIGEIIGGILIGPSVFGRFAPHLSASLFPVSSFAPLETLSTVGLVLFLFMVGMELDYGQLYRQRATAVAASGMSILLPFAMGALLAHSLRIRFAPQGIGSIPFVLFLGIAMSITAFPVLARILEERNLQSTPLGTTAILCAAVDDVVAWSLLDCPCAHRAIRRTRVAPDPSCRTCCLPHRDARSHPPLGGTARTATLQS
jgi:Kef-type K+ transport system membrane component KefB